MPPEQQGQTYALTLSTFLKRHHFREDAAALFLKTILSYREQGKFFLHGFAIMPDHVHLLITTANLSKSIQLIKGGYSFAAHSKEIWQSGHYEHRIRNFDDYINQLQYIAKNPPPGYFYVHTQHRASLDLWH